MVHRYSKISSLCRKYGFWAGKDRGCGRIIVWGGEGHMDVIGVIRINDDWGEIERCVIGLSMLDSFRS